MSIVRAPSPAAFEDVAVRFREPAYIAVDQAGRAVASCDPSWASVARAVLPPIHPEWLGGPSFPSAHGTRFSYVVGEMANGIATARMVVEAGRAGCLGVFGAAGLTPAAVEPSLHEIAGALGPGAPWGANLIHSPAEPALEDAVVDLYLRHDVPCVSASAFMTLTPAVVRIACAGLATGPDGFVVRPRRMMVKVSRHEVARRFLMPAPSEILDGLVNSGGLTAAEATLAARIPLVDDVTAESDSGGHTDNRPLAALLPTLALLRDELSMDGAGPTRLGAAGGLGTPAAVAAAYSLGASYVLTGSINQACVEAGLSELARRMLADAEIADVVMAPAADMFELGIDVQVLQRGTLFGARARRLYSLFRAHESLEALPPADRQWLVERVFRRPIEDEWAATRAFWTDRDAAQVQRAERDPRHRMALVFRSYLGQASKWAISGDPDRQGDYQIWCGPSMGAFNAWVAATFLDDVGARRVGEVALNLLEGAAQVQRAQQLRGLGVGVGLAAFAPRPRRHLRLAQTDDLHGA